MPLVLLVEDGLPVRAALTHALDGADALRMLRAVCGAGVMLVPTR
ncbi:hypothetical protein F4553_000025 [Allocatelliglobosispora scoriae]|uniref:Uncharacterized protein n=1 Tax=Allocatelliglobosispora scoriae TaxID=643052 RepID=A0A841BHK1_9ACTN|nr:hypothetical protein [Allocatelliglobosispora scoriae]MBB5866646.1 hypothetical protein [Allocatelliglobosispora scoriae]